MKKQPIFIFSAFALFGFSLFLPFSFAYSEEDSSFSDVSPYDDNYAAIEYLVEVGALSGYSDGTFLPDKTVNRAELAKILVAGQQIEPDSGSYQNCFSDVGTDWYAPYVCYAKEQGWISGYSDGTYKPAQTVNKVEAVKMVLNGFGLSDDLPSSVSEELFDDTDNSQWYAVYLSVAKDMNLLEVSSGDYLPSGAMSRGWVSEYVFRAWVLQEMGEDAYDEDLRDTFFDEVAFTLAMPERSTLFATMQSFQSGGGFAGDSDLEDLIGESWLTLREDSTAWETFMENLEVSFNTNIQLTKEMGFSSNRDVAGAFAWNVIEPEEGEFDWELPDATVAAAGEAGVTLVATLYPYSSWNSSEETDPDFCVGIDFAFFDYMNGLPTDLDAYADFVTKTVERYDGDGEDDMEGLEIRVEAWEVANEVEGPCSGSLSDPEVYQELLEVSYEAIKAADSDALVLNAGALEVVDMNGVEIADTVAFWETFFENGGADYLDVFNFHYNRERTELHEDLSVWTTHVEFFRDLLDESGHEDTRLWVTEYGTFGGDIEVSHAGGDSEELSKTEEEQASWIFRTVVIGMAHGLERFFLDLKGPDGSGIGSSSLLGSGGDERDFVATLRIFAEYLEGFDSVEILSDEQYQFTVGDTTVYALWDGDLPSHISGDVEVISLDGNSEAMDASEVEFSEDEPVLVVVE